MQRVREKLKPYTFHDKITNLNRFKQNSQEVMRHNLATTLKKFSQQILEIDRVTNCQNFDTVKIVLCAVRGTSPTNQISFLIFEAAQLYSF